MIQPQQSLPDAVSLECTHCGVEMTSAPPGESRVRYFCCPSCHRWTSSMSLDRVGRGAGVREARPGGNAAQFEQIKARMARWSQRLDRDDPYATLGVAPSAESEQVRERYRELAREHHPDHGGSAAEMRRVNEAYERIRRRAK